jgi:hypothetical protein
MDFPADDFVSIAFTRPSYNRAASGRLANTATRRLRTSLCLAMRVVAGEEVSIGRQVIREEGAQALDVISPVTV